MSNLLGKAQLPSDEHPLGVAVCGTPITPGLIVWTNEYRVGKVVDDPDRFTRPYWDGWFDVEYPEGGRVLQNQERVATVFEGKRAVAEWLYRVTSTAMTLDVIENALENWGGTCGDPVQEAECEAVLRIVKGWRA